MLFDEFRRKAIVACRHGCVRGEHDLRGDATPRLIDANSLGLHAAPDQLQGGERAVSLVQVNDAG